ncbi:MAG: alpha-mannosidase [FCB group bacterium]|nr:alpha-mannosidase [FCB group bacterium]
MNEAEDKILSTRVERFGERLKKTILSNPIPLEMEFALSDGETVFADREKLDYRRIGVGEKWGERWAAGWFRFRADIPSSLRSKTLVAHIDLGGEGLVFDRDGNILQGISSGSVFDHDFNRDLIHFDQLDSDEKRLELWVEAAACGLFGVFTEADPSPDSPRRYGHFEANIKAAEICSFDFDRWQMWLDLETVRSLLVSVPTNSVRRARLLYRTTEVIDALESGKDVAHCRKMLTEELGRSAEASALTTFAVGHAHIDTAWLWPVRESIRKCARTFSSQLKLIEKYPDYVFGASQPQHYQFIKDHYPALYARIKEAVKKERWEVQGGMWVEADCNIIGGEAMIRQILHGKNFFRDEFGIDVNNLWLPDVFGYSAALPQILRRSGIKYFLTQKMSWNQYTKFPHHTFLWEGIDGSRVMSHFPPEDNYNSSLRPESLVKGAERFRERGFVDQYLSLFGVGDGGGGPKEEHIEFGIRGRDTEGMPKVRFAGADLFFERLEQFRPKLPIWSGELYLELHRGTLTTQARNKKWNRRLESRLREIEMLWSCLPLKNYPLAELDKNWKMLLLNQFHDILPGSSITKVYEQTEIEYRQIEKALDELLERAKAQLFSEDADSMMLFNPTSNRFEGPIALPTGWTTVVTAGEKSVELTVQQENSTTVVKVGLDPFQFLCLEKTSVEISMAVEDNNPCLENDLIRYEFDETGRLINAYDKEAERTVSLEGQPCNVLTLYNDRPNDWDAWDIDRHYEQTPIETPKAVSTPRARRGPVRQTLEYEFVVGNSRITQRIELAAGSKRLDFHTKVDWQESHRMLRVAFPVDVMTNEAAFDIQYGYVKRPNHRNTSRDLARFETVAHRYVDLSEPDYGVALLNDCKYGHKVLGRIIDLCLLRSPSYPDPDADRGLHSFTYSLLPHLHDLVRSNVMAQASALNQPPLVFNGVSGPEVDFPVGVNGQGISLEVVKKAEKEACLVIRLVETNGCHSKASLNINSDYKFIEECDLMEWKTIERIEINGRHSFNLHPFEIRTFKLKQNRD